MPAAQKNNNSSKLPGFDIGSRIRVHVNIKEGDKERVQAFEGTVISKQGGAHGTFTVRKVSFGVGVERIFPMDSPKIVKIEVKGRSAVKRAKLYYLRKRQGKAAKLTELKN